MTDEKSECELWAMREFEGASLGDKRRNERLTRMAQCLASDPGRTMSTCCGRNGAQAVSRLMNREEVTYESVLRGHYEKTRERCCEHEMVLAAQDTTFLDFGDHPSTKGLGPIGDSEDSRGLCMHSVLMLTPNKTPLGLAGMQMWARDPGSYGISDSRRNRPIS